MAPTIPYYNFSSVTNSTDGTNILVKLMRFTSDPDPTIPMIYDYLPGLVILLSVAIILFLSLKIRGATTPATFSAVCVVNFILTVLMYPLQIISGRTLVVGILLVPISFFVLWISQT